MMHFSVAQLSRQYFQSLDQPEQPLASWYFCDNAQDADECAELVLSGIKRATSPSLWWYEANNEPLPKVGDLNIVTNWAGQAQCIIETTEVIIVPYNQISAAYAEREGEGDRSLAYWQKVHWPYYHRELKNTQFTPVKDMPIVCESFRVVFSAT